MLELITAIIFSISANLDNIIIGISYGTKKITISFIKNMLLTLITTTVTFLAMYFGKYLTLLMSANIANIFGSSILIIIGLYTIIQSIIDYRKNRNKNIITENRDNLILTRNIRYKELMLLAVTLSWNNLATGIAASITGINLITTLIFTFIFGALFIFVGNKIGNKVISNLVGEYSSIISGLLLIFLGTIEIITI